MKLGDASREIKRFVSSGEDVVQKHLWRWGKKEKDEGEEKSNVVVMSSLGRTK